MRLYTLLVINSQGGEDTHIRTHMYMNTRKVTSQTKVILEKLGALYKHPFMKHDVHLAFYYLQFQYFGK